MKRRDILLLIDADAANKELIQNLLADGKLTPFHLEWAKLLSLGLQRLREEKIAAVLLNPNLPDSHGMDALKKVQQQAPDVPVVVITADEDESLAVRLLRKGAQDYLTKGEMSGNLLMRTIRHSIDRKKAEERIRKSETRYRRLSENLEEMVKRKAAELQQAENLAALGRMVSILAHEIRNPLQTIHMGVENLRKLVEGDRKLGLLEEINYGARLLGLLVSDLLEYSQPIRLQRSSQPLGMILAGPLEGPLQPLIPADASIKIRRDIERPENKIPVDLPRIQLALENVLRNALESMPNGGTLSIRSRFIKRNSSEMVQITIADTGIGMSQEDMQRVDEPFYTTKLFGTGLGFPLAKKIIEAHNGTVKIRSKPGKGTRIQITLPSSPE